MARRARTEHTQIISQPAYPGGDWMAHWLAHSTSTYSDKSGKAYHAVWRRFLEALAARGVTPLTATARDLSAFFDSQSLAATALRYARLIDRVYQHGLEWAFISINPMSELRASLVQVEERAKVTPLVAPDTLSVVARLPPARTLKDRRDHCIVTIALAAGLRLAEIRALRLTDLVETPKGLEVRPRTGALRTRDLALEPWLAAQVKQWLIERAASGVAGPLVFPGKDGGLLPANTLYRRVRRLLEAIGQDSGLGHFGIGILRTTYAKQLSITETPEVTQQRLGHRRLASTRRLLDGLADSPPDKIREH